MNVFCVTGRIGRDAESRNVGDTSVTSFSVAFDEGFGDRKTSTWLNCSLWGGRGEKVSQYLTKGSMIGVSGSISQKTYQDKTTLEMRVNDVTLLGAKGDSGSGGGSKPAHGSGQSRGAGLSGNTRTGGSTWDDDLDVPF